jgi:radical SAM protein with 4Fe4S-binding SPASM domain
VSAARVLNVLFFVNDRIVPPARRAAVRGVYERVRYYASRVRLGRDRFSSVELETNSACNRKCRICPRHKHARSEGLMSESLYGRILDQLAAIGFGGRVSPVFYNEPLLDGRLAELMRRARERLPRSTIVVFTNGSLLTREGIAQLVDAGVDTLLVSQYAGNLRADAAPYAEAVKDLPERYRRHIRYRVLEDDDPLSTSGGLVPVRAPVTRTRCMQASLDAVVTHDGDVVLCCNDYHARHVFGNVREESLTDIWDKPAYRELRRQLRHGDFRLDICKRCASGELGAETA